MKNLAENGAWAYLGTAQFFEYSILSHEWVKLRTSNFVARLCDRSEQKPIKNFGTSSRGRTQGLSKISGASRGHLCGSSTLLSIYGAVHNSTNKHEYNCVSKKACDAIYLSIIRILIARL